MNMIDAKKVMAMAEYSTDKARAKLDDAIDSEEIRDELISARAQEIEAQRLLAMAPIDVVCGMQSVLEGGAAKLIAQRLLMGDMATVGLFVRTLIHSYIKEDSETMAQDWMMKIEREANLFGGPQ